jgi:peptide deformylase
MEPTAMVNPEITWRSTETDKDWEGCLTVPGIRGLVPRHRRIEVRYLNRDNRKVEAVFEGFIARVFLHEVDHLDGKVFIDRVEDPAELMMEREWQRMIAGR